MWSTWLSGQKYKSIRPRSNWKVTDSSSAAVASCCVLCHRQGILSTLSQSTQLKPVMDGCSIQGELMAFIFLAPQKLGKSTMTCLLRLHGTEKDLTNYIIHVYLLSWYKLLDPKSWITSCFQEQIIRPNSVLQVSFDLMTLVWSDSRLIWWFRPSNLTWSDPWDQVTVLIILYNITKDIEIET